MNPRLRPLALLCFGALCGPTRAQDVFLVDPHSRLDRPALRAEALDEALGTERELELRGADALAANAIGGARAIVLVADLGQPPSAELAATLDAYLGAGGGLVLLMGAPPSEEGLAAWGRLAGAELKTSAPPGFVPDVRRGSGGALPSRTGIRASTDFRLAVPPVACARHVFAEAGIAVRGGEGDEGAPFAWLGVQRRGRMFASTLGFESFTWERPEFVELVADAIAWAMGTSARSTAPRGAWPLFEGAHADLWRDEQGRELDARLVLERGTLLGWGPPTDMLTRAKFGDCRLHLEFQTPDALNHSPGRAGLRIEDRYEIVLCPDPLRESPQDEVGALRGLREPALPAARWPGDWEELDVWFKSARFDETGRKTIDAHVSVALNGVLIHDHVALPGPTEGGAPESDGAGPLRLVNTGTRTPVRNLWCAPTGAGPADAAGAFVPHVAVVGYSDAALRHAVEQALAAPWIDNGEGSLEAALLEIVERGGAAWEAWLQERLDRERARPDARGMGAQDLELLTALRRVQGRRDPLGIEVANAASLVCEFPALPRLKVALVHQDEEGESFQFSQGGDYRSGRLARWRVELEDETGRALPTKDASIGIGGGLMSRSTLAPGERWETELLTTRFVEPTGPGSYVLRVLYHDHLAIADWPDHPGRILHRSPALRLEIRPRQIVLPRATHAAARAAIAELQGDERVCLIEGGWKADSAWEGTAEGPAALLWSMGYDALPALFDALTEEHDPHTHAHVLALLSSITGLLHPEWGSGILGDYTLYRGHAGARGGAGSASFGGSRVHDTLNSEAQAAQRERWLPWRAGFELELLD